MVVNLKTTLGKRRQVLGGRTIFLAPMKRDVKYHYERILHRSSIEGNKSKTLDFTCLIRFELKFGSNLQRTSCWDYREPNEGFNAMMVVLDRFSKMVYFASCRKTLDTFHIARFFLKKIL